MQVTGGRVVVAGVILGEILGGKVFRNYRGYIGVIYG